MPNRVTFTDELARRWTVKQEMEAMLPPFCIIARQSEKTREFREADDHSVMEDAHVKEGDTGVKARVGF